MHRAVLLDAELPLGIVLAMLASLSAGVLARAWSGFGGLAGYALGWVAAVQVLALEGPGGDVLVPSQPLGYAWIYGGILVVAVVAFLPRSWFSERPVRSGGYERLPVHGALPGPGDAPGTSTERASGQFGTHA